MKNSDRDDSRNGWISKLEGLAKKDMTLYELKTLGTPLLFLLYQGDRQQ